MKKILSLSFASLIVLIVAVLSARVSGQARPVPQGITQLHLLDCAPPCWLGIVPGATTVAEAKAKLLASFDWQYSVKMMDSGFADGPVVPNAIENAIEGDDFRFVVRLNISTLVDGRSETVQSIGLSESHDEARKNLATVGDILGTFGAPQGVVVDELLSNRYEITLKYEGLEVVFYTYTGQVQFTENPLIYLGDPPAPIPDTGYRPWKGFSALDLRAK